MNNYGISTGALLNGWLFFCWFWWTFAYMKLKTQS